VDGGEEKRVRNYEEGGGGFEGREEGKGGRGNVAM
jgi:hypothetical protein